MKDFGKCSIFGTMVAIAGEATILFGKDGPMAGWKASFGLGGIAVQGYASMNCDDGNLSVNDDVDENKLIKEAKAVELNGAGVGKSGALQVHFLDSRSKVIAIAHFNKMSGAIPVAGGQVFFNKV
jgi:hypothetical protein